jgi:hypothetical protein
MPLAQAGTQGLDGSSVVQGARAYLEKEEAGGSALSLWFFFFQICKHTA